MSSIESSLPTTDLASDGPQHVSIGEDRPTTNFQPAPPSDTVEPTQVETPTQQAATQPGSGGVQHIVVGPPQPSFNQKVVGYAKEIRGTLLHKSDTKDEGAKIRKGEAEWPPRERRGSKGESMEAEKPMQ